MQAMTFTTSLVPVARDRVLLPVPFDPDAVWGARSRHHVAGTVNGIRFRGVIETVSGQRGLLLGPAWRRDGGLDAGDAVTVELAPEGPQRSELPADLATALDANPTAGEFFDSLAQFYRKGYLTWIDATRRNPGRRAERIAVVVQLLADGRRTRPRQE